MPRRIYKPDVKAAIIKAATAARKAAKPWAAAHTAAKEAGYAGSVVALQQMVRLAGGKKAKAGRRAARRLAVRKYATAAEGLEPITKIINKLAMKRAQVIIGKAIRLLQQSLKA